MEIKYKHFFDKVITVNLSDEYNKLYSTNTLYLDYVSHSNWIIEQFLEEYIKDEEIAPCNYLTIHEIFTRLKESDKYKTFSYREKRKVTMQSIIDLFKQIDLFKDDYIEELDTHYKGVKIHKRNVIKYWKIKL